MPFTQALQAQKRPLSSSQEGRRRVKIPRDDLSGPLPEEGGSPGGGRQPEREQHVP